MKKYYLNNKEMELDEILQTLEVALEKDIETLSNFEEEAYVIGNDVYTVGVTCDRVW